MTEDTSLFQEIDDAIRADRLEEFWKRYSGVILAFCVLTVLSSAASVMWKNHVHDANERQTHLLIQGAALEADSKYSEAIGYYEKAEDQGGALATLAGLKHAQALLAMKQDGKALDIYNAIAGGKMGNTEDLREFATLQANTLAHNQALTTGKDSTINVNPSQKGAFGPMASELAAVRAFDAGDSKAATALLTALVSDDNAPVSARQRAGLLLETIKGDKK